MAIIDPIVRHMIVCEDMIANSTDPSKVSLVHLLSTINAPSFPFSLPKLCVFLRVAGGRGIGSGRIVVVRAADGTPVYSSREYRMKHPADPLQEKTFIFRIKGCVFPSSGLYWIQFRHDTRVIEEQGLLLI